MRSRTEDGFTLVEVMVSLVIMLMVVTVAFSGLRIGLNAWERGGRTVDQMDRRETVERLIQRQLAVAYPTSFKIKPDQSIIMFRGSSERLEFVSDYSLESGPGDFRKIDYAADSGRFLYGEKGLFGYIAEENEALPERTLATFSRVAFEFLGKDQQGNPAWINEWKLGNGVPLSVQVHLDDDTFVVRMVNQ